jgi:hypothetical protein
MRKSTYAGTISAVLISIPLLFVAPPSCGCITPTMEFGRAIGAFKPPDYVLEDYELSKAIVDKALKKKFIGTDLKAAKLPSALSASPCVRTSESLSCDYWLEVGMIRKSGLRIVMTATTGSLISEIKVSSLRSIFGRVITL